MDTENEQWTNTDIFVFGFQVAFTAVKSHYFLCVFPWFKRFRDNLTRQTTPAQIEQALLFARPDAKLRLQNIGAKLAFMRAASQSSTRCEA